MSIFCRIRVVAALAVGSTLAACSGDKSTAPFDAAPDPALTRAIGEMTRPEIGALDGMAVLSQVPSIPALSPTGCSYQAASQRFDCSTTTVSGLTLTRAFTLLTAGGASQSRFDPSTTDGVRVESQLAGTITNPGSTLTIDDRRNLVLTGLLSPIHLLNGSAITTIAGTVTGNGVAIPVKTTVTTTIANLALQSGAKYPASGTVTVDVAEQVASFPSHATRIVATFNGTSSLAVAISDGAAVVRCDVDLSSGAPAGCAL